MSLGWSVYLSACLSLTGFQVAQVDLELYVSLAGLELLVFLFPSPKCWDYTTLRVCGLEEIVTEKVLIHSVGPKGNKQ